MYLSGPIAAQQKPILMEGVRGWCHRDKIESDVFQWQ